MHAIPFGKELFFHNSTKYFEKIGLQDLITEATRPNSKICVVQEKTEGNDVEEDTLKEGSWFFDQLALQDYLLLCCQEKDGGIRDKPGKSKDYYHTCYGLSGLSIAQNNQVSYQFPTGQSFNLLRKIHAVHGICQDKVDSAQCYFGKLSI